MGVEVVWMTGGREQKQLVGDSHHTITRLASSRWPKLNDTACLRFVDVCGDAVFNQAQIPVLLAALQTEVDFQESTKDREHLQKVIGLVQTATGKVHTYIVFVDD